MSLLGVDRDFSFKQTRATVIDRGSCYFYAVLSKPDGLKLVKMNSAVLAYQVCAKQKIN